MTVTVFRDCAIFDGHERLDGRAVVVEGERIADMVDNGASVVADQVIEAGGRTLMPGLIDAHYHAYTPSYDFYGIDRMPIPLMTSHAAKLLTGALQRGFTTVRDAAGADIGLWLSIEEGLIEGPRLFYCGKAMTQTGGHGDMRRRDYIEPCGCAYSGALTQTVDGVDEMRRAVREEFRKGAHHIKVFVSGGVSTANAPLWMPHFSVEELSCAVEEAEKRRSYVMAHCHTDRGARLCLEVGIRSIEHGSEIHEHTAQMIAEAGVFVVPTLSAGHNIATYGSELGLPTSALDKVKEVQESAVRSLETNARAGVKLGLGADLHGHRFHERQALELVLRGEVQDSIDVLRSATSINAEMLQMEGHLGVLAEGAYADMILIDGDPFSDLSIFMEPQQSMPLVMKGGRVIRNTLQ
ncbi:MAG: amidohydrolase family protein [Pseudomonadota bacterium]